MSVNCTLSVVEASTLAGLLPALDCASSLRGRLLAAESQAEGQGAITFAMQFAPLEQGLLLAALAGVSCHFSGDLRARIQGASVTKMQSLGLTAGALTPSSGWI